MEWEAIAYLQYSKYVSETSVRINNHSGYLTGNISEIYDIGGSDCVNGSESGSFFYHVSGVLESWLGFRVVLTPTF